MIGYLSSFVFKCTTKIDPRRHLCILMAIFFTYNLDANAQMNLGIDVGLTNNKLNFSSKYGNLKLTSNYGYMINLIIEHKLDKWLSFDASPGVIQKNYSIRNISNINQDIDNTYLHLPLSMTYQVSLLRNVNISGSFGAYYAYWISSVVSGVAPNVFELSSNPKGDELIKVENIDYKYKFTKQDNKSELGWILKLGIEYGIFNHISFIINTQYYQSITDQQKRINELESEKRNRTLALTSGILYHF